jgi:hypothetical protein
MKISLSSRLFVTLFATARLAAQSPGSADSNFGIADQGYGLHWRPQAVLPDGRILVTRWLEGFGIPLHLSLVRLLPSGQYDASFRPARVVCERVGEAVYDGPDIAIQPDGTSVRPFFELGQH